MIYLRDKKIAGWLYAEMKRCGMDDDAIYRTIGHYETRAETIGTQKAFWKTFGQWAYAGKVDES